MNYLFKQTYEVLQNLIDYIETHVFNKIGAAGGLATLNEDGKVPNSQIGIEPMTQAEASEGVVEDGRLISPKVLATTISEKVSPVEGEIEVLDERTDNINERLETVEQLAEISIGGGDIGIATAEDFDDPSAAQRAKVPTVGAVLDCMDEVPTPNSVKPVQSGGVLNSVIRDGSAFDLSAHTGGSYASLTAALAAMSEIPAAYKKGGMSIKFIQSSDNNYVQFRYMLPYGGNTTAENNKFVNAKNWQGVDSEPTANSRNLVESGGVVKRCQYDLIYKQTFSEYNTPATPTRVVAEVDAIGVKKYGLVLENVTVPTNNYLAIKLVDSTNIANFSSSSHIVRSIDAFVHSELNIEIELTDEELLSVKSIMVGLKTADSSKPTCSFTLTVYNASNEGLFKNIKTLQKDVLDISTNYRLLYNVTYNTFDGNNRVAGFSDLIAGVTKYLVIVKNISVSNNSDILVSLRSGKYSSNGYILGEGVSLTRDGYAIIENDGTYPSATCIGIVQHVYDTSQDRQCTFTVSVYGFVNVGIVKDVLDSLAGVWDNKGHFPIQSADIVNGSIGTAKIQGGSVTEEKISENFRDKAIEYMIGSASAEYYSDNRSKANIATVGVKKYHLDVTNLVGISSGNPLVVRLTDTTNIGYWGSRYTVRSLGIYYNNTPLSIDFELSDEELLSVKAVAVGMRDSNAGRPTCSFDVALYRNDANTIGKQVRLNRVSIDTNSSNIGNLSNLGTEDKSSVVGAINEIMENGISPKDDIPWNDEVYIASKAAFVRLYNPYKDKGSNVYMGQLHSHKQTMSYADFFTAHKNNGYSFIASIDYDRVRILESNPVAADIPTDFLYLCNGYEANCGAGVGQNGEHIIVLNAKDVVGFDELTQMSFPSPKSVADVKSALVANGCIAQLAHPYWNTLYQTPAKIATLKNDLRFVEIYSGLNDNNNNKQSGVEWDYALDILLSQGNFVFGTAVSDVHAETSSVSSNIIKMGAVKVFSNSLSRSEIFNALINGKYYSVSHTTKSLTDISFNDGVFLVNVGESGATVEFIGKDAEVLSTVTTTSDNMTASYQLTGDEMYVRARITFSDGKFAWTQAIMLDNKILS